MACCCGSTGSCCGPDIVSVPGGGTRSVCRNTTESDCASLGGIYTAATSCNESYDSNGVKHCGAPCYCEDSVTLRPSSLTVIINYPPDTVNPPGYPYGCGKWNGTYYIPVSSSSGCAFSWSKLISTPAAISGFVGPTATISVSVASSFTIRFVQGGSVYCGTDPSAGSAGGSASSQLAALCRGETLYSPAINSANGLPWVTVYSNGTNPLP